MKPILLALALALLPVSASAAITSECLPSLAAARAAHPRDHLAWSAGCYFKGHRGDRSTGRKTNVRNADGTRMVGANPQSVAIRLAPADTSRPAVASERHSGRPVEHEAAAKAKVPQAAPLTPASAPPPHITGVIVMKAAAPGSFADRFAAAYGATAFAMGGR